MFSKYASYIDPDSLSRSPNIISDGPDVFVIGGKNCPSGTVDVKEVGYFNLDQPADDLVLLNELPDGLGSKSDI